MYVCVKGGNVFNVPLGTGWSTDGWVSGRREEGGRKKSLRSHARFLFLHRRDVRVHHVALPTLAIAEASVFIHHDATN